MRANAPVGTAIGSVTATDADGDTVTYSLEGTNAESFDIVSTSGQIRTKAGATLTAGTTYNVTVAASDTKDRATIAVTITVIDNSPPAFLEPFASRSVAEGQPAGTAVGGPVSATDLDQGDTLTYTLGRADAASFTIGSTGQISTAVVLDYETKTLHVVGVTATDSAGESATIPVIINVTNVDPPGRAWRAGGDADRGIHLESGRELDGSLQRRAHFRVRRAVPRRQHRRLHVLEPRRGRHEHRHHRAHRRDGVRGAGAGAELRGPGRLVGLGHRDDDQGQPLARVP